MTAGKTTRIDTEHLQALFDIAVGSMDFASGFLDTDEVNHLRAVAEALGVDPVKATPSEFLSRYPHPFNGGNAVYPSETCVASYSRCGKPAADPIHQQPTT